MTIPIPRKLLREVDRQWQRWGKLCGERARAGRSKSSAGKAGDRGVDMYVLKNGEEQGPFSEGRVRGSIKSGMYCAQDLARYAGMTKWRPLSTLFAGTRRKVPKRKNVALSAARLCFWVGFLGAAIGTATALYCDTPLFSLMGGPFLVASLVLCVVAIAQGERRNATILLIMVIFVLGLTTSYYVGSQAELEQAASDDPADDD